MPSFIVTTPSWFSSKQEIHENGRLIGELKMLKRFSYALAEARIGDRTVRFGYKGWTARTIFIQDANGKDISDVENLSWWKRDAKLKIGGRTYEWTQNNWWGTQSVWKLSESNKEIMKFQMNWLGTKMEINSLVPLNEPEMLLLFFGVYLMNLQQMDATAASSGYASY